LYSLSKKYAENQVSGRMEMQTNQTKDASIQLLKEIQKVIGYTPAFPDYLRSIFSGRFQEEKYSMETI